jgi:hypothetical protein
MAIKLRNILICLAWISLALGCSGTVPQPTVTTALATPSPASTVIPSESLIPTFTRLSHTSSPAATIPPTQTLILPSITATPLPSTTAANIKTATVTAEVITQKCLAVEEPSKAGFILDGKPLRFCEKGVCTLGIENQAPREVAINTTKLDTLFSRMAVSPDRKWLAYEDVTYDQAGEVQNLQLRIVSADGQAKPVVGWREGWRLDGWSDNEKLDVERWNGEDHYIILFDPQMGEAQETLLPSLHNPYRGDLLLKDPQANYDPSYSRVTYLYVDAKSGDVNFSLWDIQADKLLWKRNAGDEGLFGSDWSSDGQQFIDAGAVGEYQNELFVVSRDGQETQLTHLSAAYPSMKIVIGNFSWSPDGRYISLWYNAFPGEYFVDWRLAILDIQTGELTDYCIMSSASQYPNSIWSPNGRQLAVQTFVGEDIGEHYLIVIDIASGKAMKLPVGGFLVGWMASP